MTTPSTAVSGRIRARRGRGGGRSGVGATRPGFAWAVPATVFFLLFAILPLVLVLVLSFTSWDGITSPHFNGLANFRTLIDDPLMRQSIWLTLLLTALGVVTQTPVSLLLGVWAAGHQRNRAVLSAIFFIPLLLSATAVSIVWLAILDPNFGLPSQMHWLFGNGNLFGSQAGAIGVLTWVGLWQYSPMHSLIYQGGARAIPEILYQAAAIDGAGRWRQFWHITLPQLRTTMITSIILMVVGGLTTFDTVLILTQGGPDNETNVTAYYMYVQAFQNFNYGEASAIALVLVVIATLISLVVVRISGYDKMRSNVEGM